MSRHTLCHVEFQAMSRLRRDPQVRTGPPDRLRLFLNGVVYLVRTGILWRDLPARFGPWNSVFRRFRRGCQNGVWERMRRRSGGGFSSFTKLPKIKNPGICTDNEKASRSPPSRFCAVRLVNGCPRSPLGNNASQSLSATDTIPESIVCFNCELRA